MYWTHHPRDKRHINGKKTGFRRIRDSLTLKLTGRSQLARPRSDVKWWSAHSCRTVLATGLQVQDVPCIRPTQWFYSTHYSTWICKKEKLTTYGYETRSTWKTSWSLFSRPSWRKTPKGQENARGPLVNAWVWQLMKAEIQEGVGRWKRKQEAAMEGREGLTAQQGSRIRRLNSRSIEHGWKQWDWLGMV